MRWIIRAQVRLSACLEVSTRTSNSTVLVKLLTIALNSLKVDEVWTIKLIFFPVPCRVQTSSNIFMFFYVLLTVHLTTVLVNNQLDAQLFFLCLFIPILYMFRAIKFSSSGESVVSIRPLVYVTRCR